MIVSRSSVFPASRDVVFEKLQKLEHKTKKSVFERFKNTFK